MIDIDIELSRPGFSLQARGKLEAEVTGLLGVSGAGKSTLLGIIAGYVQPERGRVMLDGQSLVDTDRGIHVPMYQRRIGIVFQDSRLFPHMNVRDNLLYGLKLLPAKEQRFAYRQIVDLLEIGHLERSRGHVLSGGEKQRVALG
ncbi:MAG TPA: ATP-binding cassette domain-containing protein, partial [Methylophilaceae bacterium]|nr:ATP-binding cassette domain-containing protein [Methylophilaceae bacterium]